MSTIPVNFHQVKAELQRRVKQQEVLAELGHLALKEPELEVLLQEMMVSVADTLEVELSQILELQPDGESLLLKAGMGWKRGLIGKASVGTELTSQAGYTLLSQEPIIVSDLETETRFNAPDLLIKHHVVSGISVVIHGAHEPYGVLGVHSHENRDFTRDDVNFVQSVANLIGSAIERHKVLQEMKAFNADLERRVEERTRYVQLLQNVTVAINAAASLEEAFHQVMEMVCTSMDWPLGVVHVTQAPSFHRGMSSLWYSRKSRRFRALQQFSETPPLDSGQGFIRRVIEKQELETVIFSRKEKDQRWEEAMKAGLLTSCAVPVIVDDDVVAVLELFSEVELVPEEALKNVLSQIGVQLARVVERKWSEDELQHSRNRLLEAQAIAQLGSWEWEMYSDRVFCSDELLRIYGLDPQKKDSMTYAQFLEAVHPDDRSRVDELARNSLRRHESMAFMHRIQRPDGEIRYLQVHGRVLLDDRGEPWKMLGTGLDVTDQSRAKEESYASMQLLQRVTMGAPVILWAADLEGKLTLLTGKALEAADIPAADWLGKSIYAFIPDQPDMHGFFDRAYAGEEVQVDIEARGMIYEARFSPLIDENNQVSGVIGVHLDVTERMNTLRALRRSEERYRRVIESVQNHAILTLDPEGRIRSCNASIESILGFTVEEVLGKHISFLYLEEDIMEHFADLALQSALDQGKFQYEGWRQRKDGDHVWAHVVISPMFDDQGALEGYTKVLRDMTDRKDMEERLRKSEARFRTIFMGAPAGITLLNLDGSVIVSNPVMHEMLGYSVREFGDQNFLDLIHPDDADRHQRFYDELVVGHRDRYQLETRFLREDGDEIWNNLTVALVRDSNADPMFAISMLEDISESKRIKNELDEVKFRLLESLELDRVHLAQELHDDPIQELYGLLYMINDLRELISTGTETRIVEDFKSGLERVIETLRQICGELRPPSLAPFGLEGAIREYTDEFRKNNPEIAVHLDLEYDGQTMSENVRMALYRIFQQSMANVVRHAQASRVDVRMHLNRDQVRLDITDDGVGFNVPENMVGLARDGHLGLVGASERVDMIHGHLLIQSQPGEGTHISVSAPIRSGRPTELEQES